MARRQIAFLAVPKGGGVVSVWTDTTEGCALLHSNHAAPISRACAHAQVASRVGGELEELFQIMALREIVKFPDPRLKDVSKPIVEVDDALRELARDMIEVMYDEPGIGLAAPQVGASVRMFVIDTEWSDEEVGQNPTVVLNPEISDREEKIIWEEGCLSVPDYVANVERDAIITLRGHDLDGNPIEERAEGLRAVCIQHEVDHLDGILFIDRISRLKRSLYVKKRKKQLLEEED